MGDKDGAVEGKWAQRKEAKRNMYLTSTDQVRVHRRGLGSSASAAAAQCQKCLQRGHWTYECKNDALYLKRASRTQQLNNPKLRQPFNQEKPPELKNDTPVLDTKKQKKKSTKSLSKKKRKRRASTSSSSDSSSDSSDDSSSESSSGTDSSDDESSTSSSSGSSDSDSDSSDSDSSSSSDTSSDRESRKRRSKKLRKE